MGSSLFTGWSGRIPETDLDKLTGEIDPEVANFLRENYDLGYIMKRDWKTVGSKLKGKIHIYCGDMDNYYLNNAVYLVEEFLESTTDPYYDGRLTMVIEPNIAGMEIKIYLTTCHDYDITKCIMKKF